MTAKYIFSAKSMGKECNFEASAEAKEEVIKKAKEHAAACSVCKDITEQQLVMAVREVPQTPQ